MLGKILFHLLGSNDDEDVCKSTDNDFEDLMDLEDGGWVIVDLPETGPLLDVVDPLENLLIEHPSMSVYQMRYRISEGEEELEEDGFGEEDESPCRPVTVRRHISWRLAAWGLPVPYKMQLLSIQRARAEMERKKLSHSALKRQNLTKMRYFPAEKRVGHFKQPSQRLCNY